MIITVTLNTAVDKTYTVDSFVMDRVHRPIEEKSTAGGKGINVARVLNELGREALTTGFVGGCNGDKIIEGLDQEHIKHDFVRTAEESRICIAVIDRSTGTQTEINENGPTVHPEDWQALKSKVETLIPSAEYLILSGSAPPGVPDDFYADLIEVARSRQVRTLLDSSGQHLKLGVAAGPSIVKPNVRELSSLRGRELLTREEILQAAKQLVHTGIDTVIVTMGRSGCVATDGKQAWQAIPPEIPFASAVGSGDAFVAAYVDSLLSREDIPEAIRCGTAAGAANAMTYGAGFCTIDSILSLKDKVRVSEI